MESNSPSGFMAEPPGDLWWVGQRSWWEASIPSSVTKAESVLINPLVRLPWLLRRRDGTIVAPDDQGYPTWLLDPMLLNGASGGSNLGAFDMLDRIDRFDFWAMWLRDAMRHGVGVFTFAPDSDGQPRAGTLHPHPPWRLYRGSDGWAFDIDGELRPVTDGGGWAMVEGMGLRVVVLRHSIPGGVFGRHRAEMRLAQRTRNYGTEVLDTATPSGVLTTDQPINQRQSDEIRMRWEERQQRRTIAVMGNGARYEQVTMSPVDAELVALSNLSDKQVAHMYELSAFELDAPSGDSLTYANIAEKRQDRVDGPLASWSSRLEEVLSALLPWGTRLRIDFGAYTMATTREATGGPSHTA